MHEATWSHCFIIFSGNFDTGHDNSNGLAKQAALLILGLKEKFKLTQAAMQGIIEGMTGLMQVSDILNPDSDPIYVRLCSVHS